MHLYSSFHFEDRNCGGRDWSSAVGCTSLGVVSFSWYLSAEAKHLFSRTMVIWEFFFQAVFCLGTGESDNIEMLMALQTCLF